jgi:hypothetical protein
MVGVKGIEPLITEPETVVLPITPHPKVLRTLVRSHEPVTGATLNVTDRCCSSNVGFGACERVDRAISSFPAAGPVRLEA